MDCRVVLAQTNPRLGDTHTNLESHFEAIRAVGDEADLILFPELSLTGYFLRDQVFDLGLTLESPEIASLVERSRRTSLAVGFVERTDDGRFFNSLGFFEDGRVLGVHRKVHLVSYGMFDEQRDFAAGDEFRVIESRHGRFGPLICEDVWHTPSAYVHYLNRVDAFLVASSSPARGVNEPGPGLGSQRAWHTLLAAAALHYRTWVLYAGRVGWEDGVGFGGASCAYDPHGELVAGPAGLEEERVALAIHSAELERARVETPLRRDERPEILAAALVRHVPLLRELADRES